MSKKSLVLLTALTSTLLAEECPTPTLSQITVKHREKGGVGYDEGYTTGQLFLLPPYDLPVYPFLDLRTHVFNDGQFAGNYGLGARFEHSFAPVAFGANVYYDFREKSNEFFHQVSFGVEALSDYLDLRLNGYVPVGDRTITGCPEFSGFSCNNAFFSQKQKVDLALFEGELGTNLPMVFNPANLYLAIGPYYLFEKTTDLGTFGDAWGVRFRLRAEVLSALTFGLDVTYDKIFDTKVQGLVGLTLPITPAHTNPRSRRWRKFFTPECDSYGKKLARVSRPVYHNEIIPFQKETFCNVICDPCTGCPYNFVVFCNDAPGTGCGTFENPYASLSYADRLTKPCDILYVLPGDGTEKLQDQGVILQDNQRLISSAVPFCLSCFAIPAFSCDKPLLTNTEMGSTVVTLASNNEVNGFEIFGDGMNTASFGVSLEEDNPNTAVKILNNSFSNLLATGINLTINAENNSIFIKNNSLSEIENSPISVIANENSFFMEIDNNFFDNFSDFANSIALVDNGESSNVIICSNQFTRQGAISISIEDALGGKFTINNNIIEESDTLTTSLMFTTSNSAVTPPCLQILNNTFPNDPTVSLSGAALPINIEVVNPAQGVNSLEESNFGLFDVTDAVFVPLCSCIK